MKKLNPQPQIIHHTPELELVKIEEMNKYLGKLKTKETPEIVFFGSDSWSIQVLKALEDNFNVKAVVTAHNSPVLNYFKGPILTPDKLDSGFLTSHFSLLTSDLFIVASYGKIIPQELISIPKYGALNVHPSLLPKYRGPSPVPATILNGDKETGVTIIKMDEQMDHGPVIITKKINLSGQENSLELLTKLFQLGAQILVDIIPDFINEFESGAFKRSFQAPLIAGKVKPVVQQHAIAEYCPRITKEDGYFEIDNPPSKEKLDRMIRAYFPWPGVWTKWNGKIIKFLPGNLLQMEGGKPTPFKVFLNNYPSFPIKSTPIDKK